RCAFSPSEDPIRSAGRRKGFAVGATPGIFRVGVQGGLARMHCARATPVQEIVETNRLEPCLDAGHRQAHEKPNAIIEPVVMIAIMRQLRYVIHRSPKLGRGYNSNENHAHSTATSVLVLMNDRHPFANALSTIRKR